MKLSFAFLVSVLFLAASFLHAQENAGQINIVIKGFKNEKGNVRVGLFNSAEKFKKEMYNPFKGAVVKIVEGMSKCVFTDVPYGEYAVEIFHDENENGKLDKNFIGTPTEEYGFSNNAKSQNFEKAKFTFDSAEKTIEINVK